MSSAETSLLFVPPLPPRALPAQGIVVLGRSRSCDLRLPDADTSRRHAEIVCENDTALLRDLGSTNGTRVNGAKVTQHTLKPGDRIQIGGNSVVYCRVDANLAERGGDAELSDANTHLFEAEAPSGAAAFRGDLAEIPPFAVVQILELGHKSGVLSVDGDVAGRLWLANGDPIHAETKGLIGFDAAVQLCNATAGSFRFEPQLELPNPTIQASATQLLLESARALDEQRLL